MLKITEVLTIAKDKSHILFSLAPVIKNIAITDRLKQISEISKQAETNTNQATREVNLILRFTKLIDEPYFDFFEEGFVTQFSKNIVFSAASKAPTSVPHVSKHKSTLASLNCK